MIHLFITILRSLLVIPAYLILFLSIIVGGISYLWIETIGPGDLKITYSKRTRESRLK